VSDNSIEHNDTRRLRISMRHLTNLQSEVSFVAHSQITLEQANHVQKKTETKKIPIKNTRYLITKFGQLCLGRKAATISFYYSILTNITYSPALK